MTNTNTIDELIECYEIQHEDNGVYGTVMLHACCVCKRFKQYGGTYTKINDALRHVFETSEHYEISHGFCESCLPEARKRWKKNMKIIY